MLKWFDYFKFLNILFQNELGMDEEIIRPDRRAVAAAWAQNVLKDDNVTKSLDKPYMEAVLTMAAMMEQPMKTLAVAINDCGEHYNITLKGYKLLMSDRIWFHTFCGPNRDQLFDNVKETYTQDVDGIVKVIKMDKVKFQTPSLSNSALSHRHSSGMTVKEEIDFVPPSATRRFRKRE